MRMPSVHQWRETGRALATILRRVECRDVTEGSDTAAAPVGIPSVCLHPPSSDQGPLRCEPSASGFNHISGRQCTRLRHDVISYLLDPHVQWVSGTTMHST